MYELCGFGLLDCMTWIMHAFTERERKRVYSKLLLHFPTVPLQREMIQKQPQHKIDKIISRLN